MSKFERRILWLNQEDGLTGFLGEYKCCMLKGKVIAENKNLHQIFTSIIMIKKKRSDFL